MRIVFADDVVLASHIACSRPSVSGSVRQAAGERGKNSARRCFRSLPLIESQEQATSHTEAGLQQLVDRLSHSFKEFGMTISKKKINIMAKDVHSPPDIVIDNSRLDVVDTLTYLGLTTSSTLFLDAEVNTRISKAAAVMARLIKRAGNNSQLTENTMLPVQCLRTQHSSLHESWATYVRQKRRLNSFHLRCLRRIQHIS